MEHNVKIVIGANYGDEGKGLMSRFFAKRFIDNGDKPITVFHNGSAQRGHTVDYEDGTRHVFHNFAAGAKEGSATFYAPTFLVHPMDFKREADELGYVPQVFCDPDCFVVTPFDMLADHIIEDYIAVKSGGREYGSCGYGTWSATDRIEKRYIHSPTVQSLREMKLKDYTRLCYHLLDWVEYRLGEFGVDLDLVPQWKEHLDISSGRFFATCEHFRQDVLFFLQNVDIADFHDVWGYTPAIIFEGAQGLLLDKDQDNEWTTTSKTGVHNPYSLLYGRRDFRAEVCYVTRQYVTRHGDGPLSDETDKSEIGDIPDDETNVFNEFQGNLRYAKIQKGLFSIAEDSKILWGDSLYRMSLAVTHCNEGDDIPGGNYRSYSKTGVDIIQ